MPGRWAVSPRTVRILHIYTIHNTTRSKNCTSENATKWQEMWENETRTAHVEQRVVDSIAKNSATLHGLHSDVATRAIGRTGDGVMLWLCGSGVLS